MLVIWLYNFKRDFQKIFDHIVYSIVHSPDTPYKQTMSLKEHHYERDNGICNCFLCTEEPTLLNLRTTQSFLYQKLFLRLPIVKVRSQRQYLHTSIPHQCTGQRSNSTICTVKLHHQNWKVQYKKKSRNILQLIQNVRFTHHYDLFQRVKQYKISSKY